MKIAIVVNGFPENSETFIINKVIALANAGHLINVIRLNRMGNASLKKLYKFSEFKNIEIIDPFVPTTISSLSASAFLKPILFLKSFNYNKRKFYYKLRKNIYLNIFNNSNYDIIHFEFSGIASNLLDILKYIKPKTVMSCRGSAEKVKLLTEPSRVENLQKAMDKITAVHCVSNDMKITIAPYCKNINKVFINRPAIDPFFFIPEKIKHNFNGVIILSIGRFTFQKGYLFSVLAIKSLIDKGHKIEWHIIGDGPQQEEMIFHINALGIEKNVVLHGKRNKDEVQSWLNKADIFLLTSVYEGIPNVVLEAMAMELPVVTTKSGGVDEVIEHGVDGLIAPLYDVSAIAILIEQLINDKILFQQIGKQARKKILADYTLERQLRVFEDAYKNML